MITQIHFGSTELNDAASASYALAQQLATSGHNVTLVWVPAPGCKKPGAEEMARLAEWCFGTYLVRLHLLEGSTEMLPGANRAEKVSVAVYHYLRDHPFDIAYVCIEGGLPFFTLAAQQTGVLREEMPVVVLAHEPLQWALEADEQFIDRKEQMIVCHMEKRSAEMCRSLAVPSASLRDWMTAAGWALPEDTRILAPFVPREWLGTRGAYRDGTAYRRAREIVYAGGNMPRSGLSAFCDMVDHLAKDGVQDLAVTVAGPFGSVLGEHSGGYVLRRSKGWPFRLRFRPRFDEVKVQAYLREFGGTAIFPHRRATTLLSFQACLEDGIPALAADVGGVAEIVDKQGGAASVCDPAPAAMARAVANLLDTHGDKPAGPALSLGERRAAWLRAHAEFLAKGTAEKPRKPSRPPLVSIIIAHYNRPAYLRQALESVRRQDYPKIEVVLVDDGSPSEEAANYLDSLEPEFRERGWKIIRQQNSFLGAARNAGIRASTGERIIFLDDDNALFPQAVATLVAAQDKSGADLCTTFARVLYEKGFVPEDTSAGTIQYFPTCGPTDIAMINNPYGDANAIFRRSVFDRIGYLNEMRGLSTSDWEFFLRADLGGLKLQVVPEALYWYRSDTEGMNRNAHWYSNRKPIIDVFRRHRFEAYYRFFELGIFQNVEKHEVNTNLWNIDSRISDAKFGWLTGMEPNAPETLDLLAEIAARAGRPDTAVELIAHVGRDGFHKRALDVVQGQFEEVGQDLSTELFAYRDIGHDHLRLALVRTRRQAQVLTYTKREPDQLYMEAGPRDISVAMLPKACPTGTVSLESWVFLPEEITAPGRFMIALAPATEDADSLLARISSGSTDGCSPWLTLTEPQESRLATAQLREPARQEMNAFLLLRPGSDFSEKNVLGGFAALRCQQSVGLSSVKHPRYDAPANRQRTRSLSRGEYAAITLTTPYPADVPLLVLAPNDEGIFLRPHLAGPVSAVIAQAFPPFARKAIATIEITHEEAAGFDFAMALSHPGESLLWEGDRPVNAIAFSGWTRIDEKFQLRRIAVVAPELSASALSINLAINLPGGASPSPSNAFWRKIYLAWD